MYIIDTNIFIDFLRGRNLDALRLLQDSDVSLYKTTSVVRAELLVGVEKSQDIAASRLSVNTLLMPFEVLPFDEQCALHYARVRSYLELNGIAIGSNDCMIAACAMQHGATVITNNAKDFDRIPGLSTEQWSDISF